jgi:VanZ family protein
MDLSREFVPVRVEQIVDRYKHAHQLQMVANDKMMMMNVIWLLTHFLRYLLLLMMMTLIHLHHRYSDHIIDMG